MQGDLEGSSANATAPDTTAEPTTAPDTGSTEAGSLAVESPSDDAEATSQPTPDSEESAEDDGDDEGTETTGEQTEEQKRLSRRERQRLREEERLHKAVADAIAERDRVANEAAERQLAEDMARKAREESQKRFVEYKGEQGENERLASEIADLNRQIRAEIANPAGVDLDDLEAQVSQKEARLADIQKAQGFEGAIREDIWNGIEAHMLTPLQWPEFSDQAARQRFLTTPGGIAGAWNTAREVLTAAIEARKDAEIATLKSDHESEVKTLREEMRGGRVRAGAEEVSDTTSGGAAAIADGALTPDRYSRMTSEQRAKLRSTPEGRAQIDRMVRAGAA